MFIAMNRFRIGNGFETAFEDRWRKRESHLSEVPGFQRFLFLKSALPEGKGFEFVSHSSWRDEAAFQYWMDSGIAKKSHAQGEANPPPREMFLGPPEFRGYEVILDEGMGHRTDFRSPAMDYKVGELFAKESAEQKHLAQSNREKGLPPIHIGALEGKILEVLLHAINAKKGIEIGTLGGYSATWLLKGMQANAHLITIEKDAIRADLAREHFERLGVARNVDVRTGNALDVLKNLNNERDLDFVFIDADKQNYGRYVEWALPRLRKGGLLLADNAYIWGGMNYYGEQIAPEKIPYPKAGLHSYSRDEFAGMSSCWDQLRAHPEFASIILPTGEGLGIAVKVG